MSEFVEKKVVQVVFDTAASDSAGVSNKTVAAHPSGVFIPDNAIITNAFYEVNTTFTSAADTATIGIGVEGVGAGTEDLKVAIAINDASNVWDLGLHGTLAGSPVLGADAAHNTAIEYAALKAASYVKTTGHEEVTFNVAGQVLVLGKLTLYIEYVDGL
jgi:hypothetical protein